ncbi:hypothetical protein SDC9_135451 [bioreactor metagenome]|uniref:Uncharacterized protein n=1 Tax=bioreactor metagenome TaxID=1076179 RepID=A0A645DGE5_9ZZZZ
MQIGLLAALFAQNGGQAADIDPGDTRLAGRDEHFGQALFAAEVGRFVQFVDQEAVQEEAARLHVGFIAAVVADLRAGHGHKLPGVGGVGNDLLVTGHPGIENRFAGSVGGGAETPAAENFAVGQRQECLALPLFPP